MHGRSPLLRLQSDERLITLIRRGNHHAFEALVARYQARLLAFCRHMLASREDAEDVLQEVFAAAFNAILADAREINVRPWLYRIARNRSLNHLRRAQAVAEVEREFEAGLVYSPGKTGEVEALVEQARKLPELGAARIVLHDPTGSLGPHGAAELVPRVAEVSGLPVGAALPPTTTPAVEAARWLAAAVPA